MGLSVSLRASRPPTAESIRQTMSDGGFAYPGRGTLYHRHNPCLSPHSKHAICSSLFTSASPPCLLLSLHFPHYIHLHLLLFHHFICPDLFFYLSYFICMPPSLHLSPSSHLTQANSFTLFWPCACP